jgi:hypothetical protein
MTDDTTTRLALAEQRARIALAAAGAMLVAGVVLMTAILPAEYGVDPLGTGRLFGLTSLAAANEPAAGEGEGGGGETAQSLEPVRPGANTAQTVSLKQDTKTFKLGPREGMEYKYRMEKGASFVYTWTSTGRVNFDFHGEPRGAPQGYAESYQMGEGDKASGSFFAPTPGIHGWFWENLSTDPITVTLTSTGFYDGATEFNAQGQTPHQLPDRK